MRNMHRLRRLPWVAMLVLISPLVVGSLSQAANEDTTVTLGISPQILELSINPGESDEHIPPHKRL